MIQRRVDLGRRVHAASPPSESRLRDFASLSPRMQAFMALARKVVDADSSLLLLGETGTGKEWFARAVHKEGPRSAGPFVAVNCGAFPESLFESELFGHEQGAFTGASRAHKGYFEQAEGGTLFLDEIGELPLHLQVKLLRVLEDRRVQRLGAERSFRVDIRLLVATHRDLEREVEAGRFREDLFYRLAVVTLPIPPLRERAEDIPDLFASYLEFFRAALNRPIYGVQKTALEALARYRWPGNVRELINVVERAVLLSPGPEIGLTDLPITISSQAAAAFRPLGPLPPGEAQPPWLGKPFLGGCGFARRPRPRRLSGRSGRYRRAKRSRPGSANRSRMHGSKSSTTSNAAI
jgi:DNA-binding NtrC family response regulator